jgi:hypothetical protein
VTETEALGTTAPDLSVTTPLIVPVNFCPHSGNDRTRQRDSTPKRARIAILQVQQLKTGKAGATLAKNNVFILVLSDALLSGTPPSFVKRKIDFPNLFNRCCPEPTFMAGETGPLDGYLSGSGSLPTWTCTPAEPGLPR